MTPEDLAPELRPIFSGWRQVRLERPLVRWRLGRATARMQAPPVEGVEVALVEHGAARYRLYTPHGRAGTSGALVWMHGGGYISGSPLSSELMCAAVARRLTMPVASACYRLAPAHPYPAALEDCLAVWDDVQRGAESLGVDPRRVAVGGQSSGAGLAAALAQRLLDDGGTQPVAQWLLYAMLDDRTAADTALDAADHLVWSNPTNRFAWRSYLGRHDPRMGYAVPARRDALSGLPPAWIGVGDIDLFHAENVAYHRRLEADGVDSTLIEVPGAPHGFDAIAPDTRLATDFLDDALAWMGERVR